MPRFMQPILCFILLATVVAAAPASGSSVVPSMSGKSTSTGSGSNPSNTVAYASDDPNAPLWAINANIVTEPIRGGLGAPIMGPINNEVQRQNPDLLAPPSTDSGSISNAKWPMALSHNRMQTGGWARQQNIGVMPIATQMAGVNMRLLPGAIREMHWHTTAEWAYVIEGTVQVSAIDPEGKNYLATVNKGDLWYFPAGIPHSLQATADNVNGSEFLLVFDDGNFSEDSTLLLTDWLAHTPKDVIAKNFGLDISAFDNIPSRQLYIFPSTQIPTSQDKAVNDPQGTTANPFTFSLSQMNGTKVPGGSVKIVDSSTFKASVTIAAVEVTVEPGAMRELHWHPTQDEWTFFLEGEARITLFGGISSARTFNYQAGDVGYVPAGYGHYVENIGTSNMKFLEVFKSDKFQDLSLHQWLALTSPQLVKAHLGLSDASIAALKKTKQVIAPPTSIL